MAQGDFTPYSTVAPFMGVKPTWVSAADQERIASYQIYEEIYWNHPETFKLVLRGDETRPIYIPSARVIIETINRYTAPGLDLRVTSASEQERVECDLTFRALFARERFRAKFNSAKRFGLIHGDWIFHVVADDTKPQGSRISLFSVDPASYFPVYSDTNPDKIVKVHLAEQFKDAAGNNRVRRQTYEKTDAGILSSVTVWEPDKWFVTTGTLPAPVAVERPPTLLPAVITSIPVYHIMNLFQNGNDFGSSEIRGLERVMSGINQGITDEDIALALEGLGMYVTDNGAPIDPVTQEETDWVLGPGRVVEDGSFKRVPGIDKITPYTDHLNWLLERLYEAAGTNETARGQVDVQVAESGVALALRMAPVLATAREKTDDITDVMNQMLFDIRSMWLPVYEGKKFTESIVEPVFRDPLPVNDKVEIANAVAMVSAGIMSAATARENLAKKGFIFAPNEFQRIMEEKKAEQDLTAGALGLGASGAGDTFNSRVNAELNGGTGAPATQ